MPRPIYCGFERDAWDAGERAGRLDRSLQTRSEYSWFRDDGLCSPHERYYSRGYRFGWNSARAGCAYPPA